LAYELLWIEPIFECKLEGFNMSQTQFIVLTLTTIIVFSGGLMIGLLKKLQKRSQAHDSKITAAFEKDRPFSL
jgi:hypothetical protein